MDDRELIREISEASPEMISVTSPDSYTAFRDGKVLFDITNDGRLLNEFKATNESEFGAAFSVMQDGSLRYINWQGRRVYTLYHRHAASERAYQSDTMRQLEEKFPSLFSE